MKSDNEKKTTQTAKMFLTEPISYQVKNKVFEVEPVFSEEDGETLGSVLLRLMKSEITKA